jgi:hypothetical protein
LPDGKVESPDAENSREKLFDFETIIFEDGEGESSETSTSSRSTAEILFKCALKVEFRWGEKVEGVKGIEG